MSSFAHKLMSSSKPAKNIGCTSLAFFGFLTFLNCASAQDEHIVAHYECEQKKIVAVNPKAESFEPLMGVEIPGNDEYTPSNFTVDVIQYKPNAKCAVGYYDDKPFQKWMWCLAKYTIAFDGYKFRPRSYNLAEMRSDDGRGFYGPNGQYFQALSNGHYLAEYHDEGDWFLETGVCH